MEQVIDTHRSCAGMALQLRTVGVRTVFRYYSEFTRLREKRLTRSEALALGVADLRVGVVYQDAGTAAGAFTSSKGFRAGAYAYAYAQGTIHQPPGSAIYFSVDFDPDKSVIESAVLPFFRGVREGFQRESGGQPDYRIGVYGSGSVCSAVLDEDLGSLAWVSQSRNFTGTAAFLASRRWALNQKLPSLLCGLDVDPNETNPAIADIGDFAPELELLGEETTPATEPTRVTARSGLILRGGPGLEFPRLSLLAFGTPVFVLERRGDWAKVDVHGDGAADGFCFAAFLELIRT